MDQINREKLIEFITGLQREDGSFAGDSWGILSVIVLRKIAVNGFIL